MSSVRVCHPRKWERIARAIEDMERALGHDLAADVRSMVVSRAFRAGILARDEHSGVYEMPVQGAAE